MSEKPDCCECRLERFFLRGWSDEPAVAHGGNLGNEPPGGRPLRYFWHGDWCKHRPTKALVAVEHITAAPNGTVRVFVEGASDFSKYVWSEMEYEAAVPFPDRDARYHTFSGDPKVGGTYPQEAINRGPVFGKASDSFVYEPLNEQDGDDYMTSAWPLWLPTHSNEIGEFLGNYNAGAFSRLRIAWQGTRCRVRWGYRNNNQDEVLGSAGFIANYAPEFAWFNDGFNPTGALFSLGTLAVGCNWADIASQNAEDNVRCGVELLQGDVVFPHGYFQNITTFGAFTIPFELPRDFFVDTQAEGSPKPPLPDRFVGVEATASRISVPIQHKPVTDGGASPAEFIYGDSTNLDAASFESVVTCGARRAAVFIPPSLQSETETLPAGPVGSATPPDDGIIRSDAPLFVRRDDLNERSYNHVANADSWHATHLVRFGSPLAGRNAMHNLHLDFTPCTFPAGIPNIVNSSGVTPLNRFLTTNSDNTQRFTTRYITPSPLRTAFNWTIEGSAFSAAKGPRASLLFADDRTEPFDENPLPPAWAWDALAGQHTLTPFAPQDGEQSEAERLVPNAYHVFHEEPVLDVVHPIEGPDSDDVDRFWDIGPMTDAQFEAHEDEEYPNRTADYRLEISFQSHPQIWATTELPDAWQRLGPRDVSLEDSGMTTENHDRYSSPARRVDYAREDAGVTIIVRARVGLRTHITKVRGYRRERQKVPSEFGRLSYKIPLGRCISQFGTSCDVREKNSCLGTWTQGVACDGQPLEVTFEQVLRLVTEAQALAEFELEEERNDAYDYEWDRGIDVNGDEVPTLRRPTGDVVIRGDHDCDDVACNEAVYEFKIPLDGSDVAAISDGQEVTKQLNAGSVQTGTDENANPVFETVYRTVKIRVSKVEGE